MMQACVDSVCTVVFHGEYTAEMSTSFTPFRITY